MKYIFTITFVFLSCYFFSQDTICFITGNKLAATVKEIYPLEIKYVRFASEDGPLYTEKKTNIKYIRYTNGSIENFNTTGQVKNENTLTKIEIINEKLFYKSGELNYDKLWPLIYNYPFEQTKKQLVIEYDIVKKYKKRKMTALWFGLGGGYLALRGFGLMAGNNQTYKSNGAILFGISTVVFGGSLYFAYDNRKKEHAQRVKIAKLYNEMK